MNCVGVLWQNGRNTFEATQADGAARAARIAAEAGVERFVHISAIGTDADSESEYARTKAAGEAAVLDSMPDAVILRPSVIFGTEDGFFNQFAGLARLTPALPLVGGATRFQPVWVEDVAEAAARATVGDVQPGIYELGGPRVATFRDCMELMLGIIRRRRMLIDLPFFVANIIATFSQVTAWVGVQPLLTPDQIKLLRKDNVVSEGAQGFEAIGITPTAMEGVLESYLYAYRPYGQYTALSESHKVDT